MGQNRADARIPGRLRKSAETGKTANRHNAIRKLLLLPDPSKVVAKSNEFVRTGEFCAVGPGKNKPLRSPKIQAFLRSFVSSQKEIED